MQKRVWGPGPQLGGSVRPRQICLSECGESLRLRSMLRIQQATNLFRDLESPENHSMFRISK